MRQLFLCCFLGSVSMLSAAPSSPTATKPAAPQSTTNQSSSNAYTTLEQDEKMIRKIQEVITAKEISKGVYIAFEYRNGEVVLMGTVEKEDDKNKLEENVKAIPGIKKVDSKIVIKAPTAATGPAVKK